MTKTVDGITFYRRPASSSCPKGAWFGEIYHTNYNRGYWYIYGHKQLCTVSRTVVEARQIMAYLEIEEKKMEKDNTNNWKNNINVMIGEAIAKAKGREKNGTARNE